MSAKTWVFLDENKIKWGIYDEDLASEKSRNKLMKWCTPLRKETEEYFAKFYVGNSLENKNLQRVSRFSGTNNE